MKLWVYTNYDCNLRCTYCLAESSPTASRRLIGLATVERIVDEAVDLGFEQLYFTGGEPFLLEDIYVMLAYASERLPTTVLTNAMLFRGRRLERLEAIRDERLVMQVSLDGCRPEQHDPYRGAGSWQKTIAGIARLQEHGFRVRISTTETPANAQHIEDICSFRRSLGIADADHFVRQLAKRGFSLEGMEVSKQSVVPEITVNAQGVFWHPMSTDPDMQVSVRIFPLAEAVMQVQRELEAFAQADLTEAQEFK